MGHGEGMERSPTYGLAIDTTGPVLTLAIGRQTASEAPRVGAWALERAISTHLHPLLRDFLPPQQWSDLSWIAVLKGPGSFTGTRLGVVTARTLAQQLQVPLFGLSNLAIAAWLGAQSQSQTDWTVALSQPGQQGMVYGAVYQIQSESGCLNAVQPDQLVSCADWEQQVAQMPGIDQVLQTEPTPLASALASAPLLGQALLTLGWWAWHRGERPDWEQVLPFYG